MVDNHFLPVSSLEERQVGVFRMVGPDNTVLSTQQELVALLLSHLSLFFRTDRTEKKYLKNEETGSIIFIIIIKFSANSF